jgi:hypothetical protein
MRNLKEGDEKYDDMMVYEEEERRKRKRREWKVGIGQVGAWEELMCNGVLVVVKEALDCVYIDKLEKGGTQRRPKGNDASFTSSHLTEYGPNLQIR